MTVDYVGDFDRWCEVQAALIRARSWRCIVGRCVGVGM